MAQYTVNVQATSNTSGNVDDTFVEIKAAANVTFKVKRVRVGYGDGNQSAGVDNSFRIKLYRWDTTTGGSSSSFTPVARDGNKGAATSTVKIKNGTTALALGTTNVTVIDIIGPNGRVLFEWLARDEDDMIVCKPGGFFGVVLSSQVVSQIFTCSVDFVE
jgi:hypothetical protein